MSGVGGSLACSYLIALTSPKLVSFYTTLQCPIELNGGERVKAQYGYVYSPKTHIPNASFISFTLSMDQPL